MFKKTGSANFKFNIRKAKEAATSLERIIDGDDELDLTKINFTKIGRAIDRMLGKDFIGKYAKFMKELADIGFMDYDPVDSVSKPTEMCKGTVTVTMLPDGNLKIECKSRNYKEDSEEDNK